MDSKTIRNPVVTTFTGSDIPAGLPETGSDFYAGLPEVTDVSYDLWMLRITLRFESIDFPVYVVFDGITGFRVLLSQFTRSAERTMWDS